MKARFLGVIFGAALMLVVAACMPGAVARPAAPTAAPTVAPTAAPPPATVTPAAGMIGPVMPTAAAPAGKAGNVAMGVDADGNFYRGDINAPVRLVEFSDFQCPYCGRHVQQTEPLLSEKYVATGKVVAFFRHFPLTSIHPNAMPAAQAAYCAGQQAPAYFWGMHDWLFANQSLWSNAADAAAQFRKQALALGVDGGRYDACLKDSKTEARIQRDIQDGAGLGVEGTPAFLINDWLLVGAYPFAEFEKVIAKAARGLHPPPTPTPLPANVQPYDVNPGRPGFTYDGSPSLGAEQAPVLLFVFSDFGCPACVEFSRNVELPLREKYVKTGQVRLIFKFLPINAPQTALAAFCAADQGKFWEFSDRLAAEQGKWQEGDVASMSGYARDLGLDVGRFDKCVADAVGQAQIDADMELAAQLQIGQAPYFLVLNPAGQVGQRVPNLVPLDQFEQLIRAVQKPQSAAPTASNSPTPAPVAAIKRPDLPVGVDADGNFYRGDPKAPIRLVDFSDFQ